MPSKYEKERLKAKKEAAKKKGGKKATEPSDVDSEPAKEDFSHHVMYMRPS